MLFAVEHGKTYESIVIQAARDKLPLPDKISNSPELYTGLEIYYQAFLNLSSCRSLGAGGEGPISWLSIAEYARIMEFEDEQKDDLFFFIQKMDIAYLKYKADKAKADLAANRPKAKR